MKSSRQTFAILAVAALMGVAWTLALRVLPRPALAETNYEANRLRIENWLLGPPAPAVIVGTSLAGRLLPAYFDGTPLAGTANLGLDGASPATGLALSLLRETAPKFVFLEVHLLSKPPGANDQQLLDLATGVGLQVSRYVPLTRADARPSTVLYGWLKERQGNGTATGDFVADVTWAPRQALVEKESSATNSVNFDPNWRLRVVPLLQRLQQRSSRIVLIRLPTGGLNPTNPEKPNEVDIIAGELGLPLVDLVRLSREHGVSITYTDGLHLTPSAAREVSHLLAEAVAKLGTKRGTTNGSGFR